MENKNNKDNNDYSVVDFITDVHLIQIFILLGVFLFLVVLVFLS